jgi:hypothetical protein
MQRAKTFFYVSLGILALALSFHLGAQSAHGQAFGSIAFGRSNTFAQDASGNQYSEWVVMQNGDVYGWQTASLPAGTPATLLGNLFSGSPVQTKAETWGRIKADRR